MRIGFDVRLTYYTHSGIARYMRRLAEHLPAAAPTHELYYFYRRGHTETLSTGARRCDCWTPAHHRLERLALAAEIWPRRLHLLHSPDFIPPAFGYRRAVITVHDLAFLHYPQFLTAASRRYYNQQIQTAVRQAAAIISVSQATKADLINQLNVPPEKIHVIYHGLDPEFKCLPAPEVAATLARYQLAPGYVLFVGTFEPRKNVPALLRAYARLRAALPAAPPLVLAGNRGWLFAETQALAHDLALEPHLRWLENFPSADLPALYTGAGVFVLPSHSEGFGMPVIEAMGCGTPVVIADRGALPEIAGPAALSTDPDEPDGLAHALAQALTDPALRASLRARGLARAGEFTWPQAARATVAVYNQTLADCPP